MSKEQLESTAIEIPEKYKKVERLLRSRIEMLPENERDLAMHNVPPTILENACEGAELIYGNSSVSLPKRSIPDKVSSQKRR